jgi:hypothetical protein
LDDFCLLKHYHAHFTNQVILYWPFQTHKRQTFGNRGLFLHFLISFLFFFCNFCFCYGFSCCQGVDLTYLQPLGGVTVVWWIVLYILFFGFFQPKLPTLFMFYVLRAFKQANLVFVICVLLEKKNINDNWFHNFFDIFIVICLLIFFKSQSNPPYVSTYDGFCINTVESRKLMFCEKWVLNDMNKSVVNNTNNLCFLCKWNSKLFIHE